MNQILNKYTLCLLLILAAFMTTTSCVDDFRTDFGVIDGSEKEISVTFAFEPNSESNLASRSESGTSIQNINTLRMLVYDKEGNLIENMDYCIWKDGKGGYHTDVITNEKNELADNRLDSEKSGEGELEDNLSGKVTCNLKIPTGEYYIYGVANVDDLDDYDYSTRDKLKSISRTWNPDDISANSEMFGIFDVKSNRDATDDKPIKLTTASAELHCWLRRLASKVTVAFDGTGLYDNVQVYIESIALKDIPKTCSLGNANRAGQSDMSDPDSRYDKASRYTVGNGLIENGDVIVIQTIDGDKKSIVPANFIHVCNTSHAYLGKGEDGHDEEKVKRTHAHTAESLFFYENIQGEGKDKRQDYKGDPVTGGPDGALDHPGLSEDDPTYVWKDDKPYGTYIEVKGWYRCVAADGHVGDGPITYRFMLGKDVLKDYNVERNTHYKLTLCLKGYGNDADWHIEYEHERGIHVSSPQYISYLYNKKMMATVKIKGKIPNGYKLRAKILKQSNWKPWGDGSESFQTPSTDFYYTGTVYNDGPWLGFLSLRQTHTVKLEYPGYEGAPSNIPGYTEEQAINFNESYFNGTDKRVKCTDRGCRYYEVEPSETGYESNDDNADGMYFVSELDNDATGTTERLFRIPLYTRAKELITKIGFTGNNPYTSYPRKTTIEFTVVKSETDTMAVADFGRVYLDMIQVRRILNPKGVWRSKGSTEPFHVCLMRLPNENADEFEPFLSEGKWSAEVISKEGAQIVTLSSTIEGSGNGHVQSFVNRIEGESEHNIDFWINFNGSEGNAIIKVRYHNLTCEHDIYCRNGYEEPIAMFDNSKIKWPSYNIAYFENGKAVYTKSPLEEGSLFRHCNNTAILASNNTAEQRGKEPAPFEVILPNGKKSETNVAWGDITPSFGTLAKDSENRDYYRWEITNEKEHIARGEDYYELIASEGSDMTFPIGKAYGILYGDGATGTIANKKDAWGYDNTDGTASPKGMRGVFVFNSNNCRQIFFPIGTSGYGHRKAHYGYANYDPEGALRYAGRSERVPNTNTAFLQYRPLFIDLAERPGAVYWMEHFYKSIPKKTNASNIKFYDASKSVAFDINFFTMGFEGYGENDAMTADGNPGDAVILSRSHACFIRTVIENP